MSFVIVSAYVLRDLDSMNTHRRARHTGKSTPGPPTRAAHRRDAVKIFSPPTSCGSFGDSRFSGRVALGHRKFSLQFHITASHHTQVGSRSREVEVAITL